LRVFLFFNVLKLNSFLNAFKHVMIHVAIISARLNPLVEKLAKCLYAVGRIEKQTMLPEAMFCMYFTVNELVKEIEYRRLMKRFDLLNRVQTQNS